MKTLREATFEEMDAAFREATVRAATDSFKRGLPVTGLDADGNLVTAIGPIDPDKPAVFSTASDDVRQQAVAATSHPVPASK